MKPEELRKTMIYVEVLSQGDIQFNDLAELHSMIMDGNCSGSFWVESSETVDEATFVKLCEKQCTDPSFFGLREK